MISLHFLLSRSAQLSAIIKYYYILPIKQKNTTNSQQHIRPQRQHQGLTLVYNKVIIPSISLMNQKQNQKKNKIKIVGDFQLGKKIGVGTFATVEEGIHLPTKQKVAIKILHKSLIVDAHDKINISRQMRIVKNVRHPNIIKILQIIETNKKIYIVMEKVEGGELFEEIINSQKAYLQQQRVSWYFQQLLNAIEYLHSLGVTHRDIKPENILLAANNSIKLIDFGLSNYFQDKQLLSTACGSPCYAAPEMLSKKSYDPHKTDLWSCGIVLYTMLVGYLPFQHEKASDLLKIIEIGIYDEPSHLSIQAKDILRKMLQINPEKRITLNQIRNHSFCMRYSQKIVKGLLPNDKVYLDSEVIETMKTLGYSGFFKDVQQNNLNENSTVYYLLLMKKLEKKSISLLEYYQKMIQKKNIFRSKSIVTKRYDRNPQDELPSINKNPQLISMKNLNEMQSQIFLNKLKLKCQSNRNLYSSLRVRRVRR